MRSLLTTLLLLLWAGSVAAAPVKTEYSTADLLSNQQQIKAGDTFYLGLELELREHWHSYWINPGDAGLATAIQWDLPPGLTAGDIEWPTPKAIPLGVLVNYGYEGKTLYPVPFTAGPDFIANGPVQIKAFATWLVCEDICVPDQANLSLRLNTGAGENKTDAARIAAAVQALPKPVSAQQLQAGFSSDAKSIQFHFAGPLLQGLKLKSKQLRFFPTDSGAVKHSAPQTASFGENGFTLWTKPGFRAKRGQVDVFDGVLVIGKGKSAKAWSVSAKSGLVPAGSGATTEPSAIPAQKSVSGGLLTALLFAFLGGVLLNLMPCVFPVLSMKVMSFVSAAHAEAAKIRRHGILFLIGVLLSFLFLGGLLLALKAGGQQVGWGFQLQSPIFVAAVAILFFVLGLNLLGVFQIGGRLMGVGSSLTEEKGNGNAGAFFTGVLAVVVASPCTAPAMGWALGYTLTQSAPVSLLVFAALGLGFAAPFTLLSLRPGLLKFLPKPGAWMERFHQLMAFPMFGAAIWLVWVLGGLSGSNAITAMLIAFLLIGFAFWAAKGKWLGKSTAVIAGVLALFTLWNGLSSPDVSKLQPEPWSVERVAELRAEGKVVFVDFTADWCVTCQFNKKTSLSTKRVAQAFAKEGAAFLVADWTKRDDAIAAELARHGRAGVPLYLVYKPGQSEPDILPQILTPKMVEQAITSTSDYF
ncbi:Cytochrome c-type biogenesis protein DsbD, protein-disulfide reductase [hydrothermal vent metagenome]|uniref:Cytochrome c-type biogenesis protein DsbD, protein-disulfide reductase n=1 Tax=hydrothermal vent metagenome TaxID=652676 RepID=A0A3B0RA20_9ZZZZ